MLSSNGARNDQDERDAVGGFVTYSLGIAHSSVWKIENHSSAASPEAQPTMSMAEIDGVDICRFIIIFFWQSMRGLRK